MGSGSEPAVVEAVLSDFLLHRRHPLLVVRAATTAFQQADLVAAAATAAAMGCPRQFLLFKSFVFQAAVAVEASPAVMEGSLVSFGRTGGPTYTLKHTTRQAAAATAMG